MTADRTLVVSCHPVSTSFTAAVLERVLSGLAASGAEVRLHDLYTEDWEAAGDEAAHFADLRWCRTLVLVHPTWWGGPPGMLTDWIVRCWPAETRRRNIRRVVAVSSHGSSKAINALEGETGKHLLARWIRPRCHWAARLTWLPLYHIDTASDSKRAAFLQRVERAFT